MSGCNGAATFSSVKASTISVDKHLDKTWAGGFFLCFRQGSRLCPKNRRHFNPLFSNGIFFPTSG
jgi:hypothetical protein